MALPRHLIDESSHRFGFPPWISLFLSPSGAEEMVVSESKRWEEKSEV